ncbi:hypothetical protein Pstu01_14020 [Stutzerimonas stutzeri]|nr:hypothetical protein Pstu01_14020 [Stutzerimonas stutzeri]
MRPLIGGTLNIKHVRAHWDDILRLASSIKQGTVTASLMLRKLGSYPRQNGLAVALRELGRIERTLFILDWLQSVELGVWGAMEPKTNVRPESWLAMLGLLPDRAGWTFRLWLWLITPFCDPPYCHNTRPSRGWTRERGNLPTKPVKAFHPT